MIILIAFIVAVVLAMPWIMEERRRVINRDARDGAAGEFVILSHGVTGYQWIGPTRGPIIVAVHGLTTPSQGLHAVAEGLGKLGFRVLTYDLYGRGLSDAPRQDQTTDFFVTQLDDLLAALNIERSVTLLGYSMGGTIVTSYAAQKPERVDQVILLASAGIKTNESSFSRFCRRTPFLGDWVFQLFGPKRMRDAIEMDRRIHHARDIQGIQLAQLDQQGFWRSVLSSRRGALQDTMELEHRKLGRREVPVIAIWGADDAVIPLGASDVLGQWNDNARQAAILGARHSLPYSHADEVVARIRPHLLNKN